VVREAQTPLGHLAQVALEKHLLARLVNGAVRNQDTARGGKRRRALVWEVREEERLSTRRHGDEGAPVVAGRFFLGREGGEAVGSGGGALERRDIGGGTVGPRVAAVDRVDENFGVWDWSIGAAVEESDQGRAIGNREKAGGGGAGRDESHRRDCGVGAGATFCVVEANQQHPRAAAPGA